ncbi:MAG: polymerase sigma-70 factor, subfamily [Actinomycetota bacterium]|jgi:RNA polymerase sigma-70 factor (ECF subfamily)|nr:polymerase sigma-70 factor, subfamily [Actinomycetota bacterium]
MIVAQIERGLLTVDRTDAPDYERLFREESGGLFRALFVFTGGRRDIAEDATAEAFARAMTQERLRDPVAWIYRTAFRLAVDAHRHEHRFAAAVETTVEPPELHDLMGALRHLSPNQRAVVLLHHLEGFTLEETATRMGIAASTARVHLHRARTKLRRLLGDEEPSA